MASNDSQQNAQLNTVQSGSGHSSNGHNGNQPPKPKKQKPEPKNKTWGSIYIIGNRIIPFAIPVIVLMSFVVILNLPLSLKNPKGHDDDVLLHLKLAQASILAEDWTQALLHIENAEKAWAIVIPRIQIGVQKDDIKDLTLSLVRLKASTESMDKASCILEIAESLLYWDEIGK